MWAWCELQVYLFENPIIGVHRVRLTGEASLFLFFITVPALRSTCGGGAPLIE